jgi:hypothetical protein
MTSVKLQILLAALIAACIVAPAAALAAFHV